MKTCVAQWNVDQLGAAVVQSSHTHTYICTCMHPAAAWTWSRLVIYSLPYIPSPAFASSSTPIPFDQSSDRPRFHLAAHLINFTFTRLPSLSPLFCPSMCNLISRAPPFSALHSRSDAVLLLLILLFLVSNGTSAALTSTHRGIKVVTVAVSHQWSVRPFTELSQNQRNQILLVRARALSQL